MKLEEIFRKPEIIEGKEFVIKKNFNGWSSTVGDIVRKIFYIQKSWGRLWFIIDLDEGDGFEDSLLAYNDDEARMLLKACMKNEGEVKETEEII